MSPTTILDVDRESLSREHGVQSRKGGLGTPPKMTWYCTAKVTDHTYEGCFWGQNERMGTITTPVSDQGSQLFSGRNPPSNPFLDPSYTLPGPLPGRNPPS